jgi:hypothetical protein
MDMINGVVFAFGDDLSNTKHQLDYIKSGRRDQPRLDENANGLVHFPSLPPIEITTSLQGVTAYLGEQVTTPFPYWQHKFRILTDATLRRKIAHEEEIIIAQIKDPIKRFNSGNTVQLSVVDSMDQREVMIAKTEGREPDFFTRRTIDEVNNSRHSRESISI